uniref:J domain-containing protein n=1 Tax=Meloidogyne incognita TaxID=6306 RepID=A0A914L577_MELIC
MGWIYLILLLSLLSFILQNKATHYNTLKVDRNASPNEIKEAFNERKGKNRNAKQSDKDFFDNLEKLSDAFYVLGDKTKRDEYDSELANKEGKYLKGEISNAEDQKDEKSQGGSQSFGEGSTNKAGSPFVLGFQSGENHKSNYVKFK